MRKDFTPKQLKELKDKVTSDLNRLLTIAKTGKCVIRNFALKDNFKSFKVYDDQNQYKVLEDIIKFRKETNGTLSHSIVEGTGRVGWYEYTEYTVKYKSVIEEVTDTIVKLHVHKALMSMMSTEEDKVHYIDCKLMQLFKDGLLSWEDTAAAHKTNCSF